VTGSIDLDGHLALRAKEAAAALGDGKCVLDE